MGSRLLQNGPSAETEAIDDMLSMPFTRATFAKGISSNPFVNELARIRHSMRCLQHKHQQKKLQIRPQYEREMENIKRKYDLSLKIEDESFKKQKTLLADLRRKVENGQSVDKEFRAHFGEQTEPHTPNQGQIPEQFSGSNVAQGAPIDQDDLFRFNSTAVPLPPRAIIEQIDSSSIFYDPPSRIPESFAAKRTGI